MGRMPLRPRQGEDQEASYSWSPGQLPRKDWRGSLGGHCTQVALSTEAGPGCHRAGLCSVGLVGLLLCLRLGL